MKDADARIGSEPATESIRGTCSVGDRKPAVYFMGP